MKRVVRAVLVVVCGLAAGNVVAAQGAVKSAPGAVSSPDAYPNRPLRIIVPFPPGGGVDIVNRILVVRLTEVLGQQVIIDNRPGAGGNVGADIAARSTPDGYTLFACGVASHGVSPAIYRKLPYDAVRDFAPVSMIGTTPNELVVNPSLPVKSLGDCVAQAKAAGGKMTYASPGVGTSPQMTMELFKMVAGLSLVHVAYKGGAPALQEVIGGHVPGMFGNLTEQIGAIQGKRTRAIAVSSLKRHPQLPDVPTVAESGYPGFEVTAWYAACAPSKVPKAVLDKLNAAIVKTLAFPDTRERYVQNSIELRSGTREDLGAYIASEIAKWKKVAQAANIYVD